MSYSSHFYYSHSKILLLLVDLLTCPVHFQWSSLTDDPFVPDSFDKTHDFTTALLPAATRIQPPRPPLCKLAGPHTNTTYSDQTVNISLPVNIVMNRPTPGTYRFDLPMRCHVTLADNEEKGLQAVPGRTRLSIGAECADASSQDAQPHELNYRSVIYIDNASLPPNIAPIDSTAPSDTHCII